VFRDRLQKMAAKTIEETIDFRENTTAKPTER